MGHTKDRDVEGLEVIHIIKTAGVLGVGLRSIDTVNSGGILYQCLTHLESMLKAVVTNALQCPRHLYPNCLRQ